MAGGFGTRLKPITQVIPKPMVPVGGRPALFWTLDKIVEAGATSIVVVTHYMADYIKALVETYSFPRHINLSFLREERPLGTFGSVASIAVSADEPFLVVNGDVLISEPFSKFFAKGLTSNSLLTVAVSVHATQCPYGVVQLDETGGLRLLTEKPTIENFVLAGLYVVHPGVKNYLADSESIGVNTLIDRLLENGQPIQTYLIDGHWIDIGNPHDLERASIIWSADPDRLVSVF